MQKNQNIKQKQKNKLFNIQTKVSMLKNDHQKASHQQLEQDLQFMLSSIRARENTLIFYLEKLKNSHKLFIKSNNIEMKLAKNQFQQKDKIYSRQITSILQKHSVFSLGQDRQLFLYDSSVRAFWIKLKTILKVSIQRVNEMTLPKDIIGKLLECYEKALIVVQRNSQAQKSLLAYRQVQNFFKKRTIETLLISKQTHSPSISYSQSKMQKNRSQTLFKPTQAVVSISRFTIESANNNNLSNVMNSQQSQFYQKRQTFTIPSKQRLYQRNYQYLHGLADIKQEGSNLTAGQSKIKSLNRIKNRKPDQTIKANIMNFIKVEQLGKLKSTSKASQKHIKKYFFIQKRINKHVQKYEKNFEGAFDGKYQVSTLLDKKKTIYENIYLLYDDLFAKNIPNHKMISKFMFNTTKINQILYNAYAKKKKQTKKDKENKNKQKNIPDGKEKQKNNGHKKNKDKQKQKQKQKQKDHHLNEDNKQRHQTAKQLRAHRKHHFATKDNQNYIDIFGLNTKQKKQSQTTAMTAMTSKQQTNHKQLNHHEKYLEKLVEKDKDYKNDKDKEKKIMRSKTAKIKLNSDNNNGHTFVLNPNLLIGGKHFVSQNNAHKVVSKQGNTQKIVKNSLGT